ncbi:MAG: hypothetical protein ACE5OZ_00345 [Candidatus Heimdallarchaeota archaeon]
MPSKTSLCSQSSEESQDEEETKYEDSPRFKSAEYQDPSSVPQRPDRWYNGSLMGTGGKDSTLFGSNGRLRSLHTKITSQETPGSQPRGQHYRLVGDILSQFFSFSILDPLIEEIIAIEKLRLPRALDEAVSIVLAAVEMYLRKNNRMILKDRIIGEIANEIGLEISRKSITTAKWLLAKGGFWKEHLYEINTATFDILRNLTLEVIANFQFPVQENVKTFRRQLYHRCQTVIDFIEKNGRRPQVLEVYAHAIASIAAEELLQTSVNTTKDIANSCFATSVYRAKRQILNILSKKDQEPQKTLPIPKISRAQFPAVIRRVISQDIPPEAMQIAWGQLLRFKTVCDASEPQITEKISSASHDQQHLQQVYPTIKSAKTLDPRVVRKPRQPLSAKYSLSEYLSILEDQGPGPPPGNSTS